jgi:hypothetical protein
MPIGNPYNGGQTPLEAAAIVQRNILLAISNYNNVSASNNYTATHTRALSDSTTPIHGKGSGGFLDITNYNGVGGEWDKNGNQANAVGSGRIPAFALNASSWGYGPNALGMQTYQAPNTSANIGQVII